MVFDACVTGPSRSRTDDAASATSVLAFPAFASRKNNPYTSSLYDALVGLGVSVHEFGAQNALARSYSVVHVHWPEVPLNRGRVASVLGARWFLALLDQARARGAKLFWTAHNLKSHEQRFPEREAAFLRRFVERVDGVISLTQTGERAVREHYPELASRPTFVVPHHHYRGTYRDDVTKSAARRELGLADEEQVLLFFGRVMAYKNLPALARAVRELPGAPPIKLLIAGRPKTAEDERALRAAAGGDPRVRLDLTFVPDERAQHYFRAADLVVLPYSDILNSGAAVLALSFDRPVLLPDIGACRELGELVGTDWVQTYNELSSRTLSDALAAVSGLPERTDGRHLARLDVRLAAEKTLAAYRAVARG